MEILEFFIFAFDGCVGALELVGLVVDGIAWDKSRPNRRARRTAIRVAAPAPRRTVWTWLFQLLTWSLIILALVALYLAIAKRSGWPAFSPG